MSPHPLHSYRILAVEDDYYLALDFKRELEATGATVVGPAPSVESAIKLIEADMSIEGAVLDMNLSGEMAYPVADALLARHIPFVFTSGYAPNDAKDRYPEAEWCEKPTRFQQVYAALAVAIKVQAR